MKITLKQKMLILILSALVGSSILALVSNWQLAKVFHQANFSNVSAVPSLVVLDELRKNYLRARIQSYRLMLRDEGEDYADAETLLEQHRSGVRDAIRKYESDGCLGQACFGDDKDRAILSQVKELWNVFDSQLLVIVAEKHKGEAARDNLRKLLISSQQSAEQVADKLNEHFKHNVTLANDASDKAALIMNESVTYNLLIAALTITAIACIGFLITRSIIRQLGADPDIVAAIVGSLAIGDLDSKIEVKAGDTASLTAQMRVLVNTMDALAKRVEAIGLGDFNNEVTLLSEHDRLGKAINRMISLLRASQAEDLRRNWLKDGQSQLSLSLTGDFSVTQIADAAIGSLGHYLNAGRGVLYIYRPDELVLDLLGSYMYTERANLGSRVKLGDGAIGQVARECKPIILTILPADAAPIITGTTYGAPLFTYTYPIIYENVLLGVLELASFERFDETKLEFLSIATPLIAALLYFGEQRQKITQLLAETEKSELQTKESNANLKQANSLMEEQQMQLQQQAEEMQQSNAQLEEQQQQLQQQTEELQQTNAQMSQQQQQLEQANEVLRVSQHELDTRARQLELSGQYKSDFLANMSHELRTPLNAIILLSKMMSNNADGHLAEEEVKRASVIHRSGQDLLRLINDVLDLSKVEAGHMELNNSEISSVSLVENFHDTFDVTAADRGVGFVITDKLQAVFISDVDKLMQILRNLISNAFKFTKQGQVSLVLERCAGATLPLRIGVRDTGIGIPKDKQALIFEAFLQADGSTSREYGGTGLGLTISKRLAQLLGGTLEVQSIVGQGSEFFLCLPEIAPIAPIPLPAISSLSDDRSRLQTGDQIILLIDDDIDFCQAVQEINRRLGYKTLIAARGADGLELARKYQPNGILLDLGLPDIDGTEVLHVLKSSRDLSAIPVYVVSARDRDTTVAKKNIIGFLQKPVDEAEIVQAENELLSIVNQFAVDTVLLVASGGLSATHLSSLLNTSSAATSPNSIREIVAEQITESMLRERDLRLVIIDLSELEVNAGLDLAMRIRAVNCEIALLFFSTHLLNESEDVQLRRYTDSIIVKSVKSEQRMVDDIERFLSQVHLDSKGAANTRMKEVQELELGKLHILLVDDDPRNLFAVTAALEQNGAKISCCINGKRALELLEKESFDVIITDIMMPEMDGYQLIEAIRAQPNFFGIPVIVLTAKAMQNEREKILELGADDFLTKPVDYDLLINMVNAWRSKQHLIANQNQ